MEEKIIAKARRRKTSEKVDPLLTLAHDFKPTVCFPWTEKYC